jgi:hypothetical protein
VVIQPRHLIQSTSIRLRPGQLEIEFFGTEDLLKQLWSLAQAITHDYIRFQEICER